MAKAKLDNLFDVSQDIVTCKNCKWKGKIGDAEKVDIPSSWSENTREWICPKCKKLVYNDYIIKLVK